MDSSTGSWKETTSSEHDKYFDDPAESPVSRSVTFQTRSEFDRLTGFSENENYVAVDMLYRKSLDGEEKSLNFKTNLKMVLLAEKHHLSVPSPKEKVNEKQTKANPVIVGILTGLVLFAAGGIIFVAVWICRKKRRSTSSG